MARGLRRPKHRPGGHRGPGPPARPHGQNLDLRPGPREMARWADIETALGINVYFCEP